MKKILIISSILVIAVLAILFNMDKIKNSSILWKTKTWEIVNSNSNDSWEVNNIYFDKKEKVWKDNYWVCHTCTPENGFMADGTTDE